MDREQQILVRRIVISAIIVLIIGTIFYRHQEGLTWVDSFYFSVITLTTVGYGDITPVTTVGKLFTTIYAVIGIGFLGLFIDGVAKARLNSKVQQKLAEENKNKSKK